MSYNFVPCNRDQLFILPPDIREWVPGDHLVWFVLDLMDHIDQSGFYDGYREDGKGNTAYDPSMMADLLVYSYCIGERSSRRIERLCGQDVAYRVITANHKPDHATIARFRRENGIALEKLFIEVLKLCKAAKMVKLGIVALDGSKMAGNTSLTSNRTHDALEEEVRKILQESEAIDAAEDARYGKNRRGDELPEDLADRRSRLARLRECKERLEREAQEVREDQQRKIDARAQEEEETGRKKRGRKPRSAEKAVNEGTKASVTDPDSRIMKTRSGFVQGYNAQAVATKEQIIIAAQITQEENDVNQLHPMLDNTLQTLKDAGISDTIDAMVCDAGYFSEANLEACGEDSPDMFIATKKDWKQRKELKTQQSPRGRIPAGLSLKDIMDRTLKTIRGRAIYAKRKTIIEPVFGQIKDCRKMRSFMMRGKNLVAAEWKLICATHNILKLFRSGKLRFA